MPAALQPLQPGGIVRFALPGRELAAAGLAGDEVLERVVVSLQTRRVAGRISSAIGEVMMLSTVDHQGSLLGADSLLSGSRRCSSARFLYVSP